MDFALSSGFIYANCRTHDVLTDAQHKLATGAHVVDCCRMPDHHGSAYC